MVEGRDATADSEAVDVPSEIRVLHVDDDSDFLDLAATFLERERPGLTVVTETDAAAGLAHVEADAVDCVVSDYEMPGTDGLAFLDAVRERRPDLPFVLYTGEGDATVTWRAFEGGATDVRHKQPGTAQYVALADQIERAVGAARASPESPPTERIPGASALLDELFAHVPTFLGFKDADCRYVRVGDDMVEELVGEDFSAEGGARIESREDILGKTDRDLFGARRGSKPVVDDRRVIETGETLTRREEDQGNHVTKIPWRDDDGEVIGLLTVVLDINPEQRSERLEEFASVVAHDIRNPLAVATGHLSLAPDDEHVAAADAALDRMSALVDDLLELGRRGRVIDEFEPVPATAARDAWEQVAPETATLELEWDGAVLADQGRFEQLLENLFRNAVEHGGEGVTVTVGPIDGEGFYVADDGPGIPPDQRDRIFEWGHSTADGTGYGLAIVERIATAHGWTVEVEASESGGARFAFRGVDAAA